MIPSIYIVDGIIFIYSNILEVVYIESDGLIFNDSVEELKQGYIEHADIYVCIACGLVVEKGIIYPDGRLLYEAKRFIIKHISDEHGSAFENLINQDKSLTGLSEHQARILKSFFAQKSDKEIQEEMQIGSISTIRNHRFALREKERQAKIFLAIMELLSDNDKNGQAIAGKKVANNHIVCGIKEDKMDRKKELKEMYKQIEIQAGIYQIRNTVNNKVLVVATANLKTMTGRGSFFGTGTHFNHALQKDIEQYGKDAFVFEVLEVLEKKKEPGFDEAWELKKLEKKWLDKLEPYDEQGYNPKK